MKIIEATPAYRNYKQQKDLAAKINKMTHSLIFILNIHRYDVGLVMLIGYEDDKNNEDAVRSWVTAHLCCASCMREKSISYLVDRMRSELNNLLDDINH